MALAISMVMLSGDGPLSAEGIRSELEEHWPDLDEVSVHESGDGMVSLQVGDANIILAKMDAPIPWSELKGPCETSILWKNAAREIRGHKLHWIVTVHTDGDEKELATLLTQATAATMAACPQAIGVYWGNATLIVPKDMFIEFATEVLPEGPPVPVWVDFRIGKNEDGTCSGFTAGMHALGLMEFETLSAPESPGDLRERLMSLAGYLIENGPVIGDGNTVGQDATEKIRVIYSKSSFGHKGKVMQLVYDTGTEKKPWWKVW